MQGLAEKVGEGILFAEEGGGPAVESLQEVFSFRFLGGVPVAHLDEGVQFHFEGTPSLAVSLREERGGMLEEQGHIAAALLDFLGIR